MALGLAEVIIHDRKERVDQESWVITTLSPSLDLAWAGYANFLLNKAQCCHGNEPFWIDVTLGSMCLNFIGIITYTFLEGERLGI